MGFFHFADHEIADLIGDYFYTIEETIIRAYEDLSHEDNVVGALQVLLMNKEIVHQVGDIFRKKGYDFDVEFRAVRERAEKVTGADFSVLLKIYTHPIQEVDSFQDVGFFARNHIKKSIVVQSKNLRTRYGNQVRLDQLRKILQITGRGGVVFFFSKNGVEVVSANDLVSNGIANHSSIPHGIKYDFTNFMYNFFETNVGDHDPRLYSAIEEGRLSSYFKYTIKPSGLRINQ
jgi:hypothetical protein